MTVKLCYMKALLVDDHFEQYFILKQKLLKLGVDLMWAPTRFYMSEAIRCCHFDYVFIDYINPHEKFDEADILSSKIPDSTRVYVTSCVAVPIEIQKLPFILKDEIGRLFAS